MDTRQAIVFNMYFIVLQKNARSYFTIINTIKSYKTQKTNISAQNTYNIA